MKRFLLFNFATYYPGGGLSDVSFSADSIQEITNWLLLPYRSELNGEVVYNDLSDYYYVWDRIEDKTYVLDDFDTKTFKLES